MKKTDLAYFAGIVDGEGSIGLYRRSNRSDTLSVNVTVVNTNEWLIQQLQFSFGGAVREDKRYFPNRKRAWRWEIQSNQAYEFLDAIFPYLHLKRPQAELVIKFQKRRKGLPRWTSSRRKPDGVRAVEEAESILLRKLNKTGVA